ncbi:MAG TPA: hypothetical protein VLK33_09510 [Terriglobales bacterium]|nr:hypothetical protein [Terriglobales bacterium]
MQPTTIHVCDEELLSFADGELESTRSAEVEHHLAACWQCRARRAEIENVITDFVRQHNQNFNSQIPSGDGPRSLLRARLAETSHTQSPASWSGRLLVVFSRRRLAYAAVAATVLILIGIAFWSYADLRYKHSAVALYEPRPELTPGAVRPVSLLDICRVGVSEKNRTVSASLQREVFRNYGIVNARPQDYEVDYLITPELGGADDIKNLWPQPFAAKNWGAYTKDDLEDRLHELVCSGKLDLATAQRAIASDWIGAYKKYVQTSGRDAEQSKNLKNDGVYAIATLSSMN